MSLSVVLAYVLVMDDYHWCGLCGETGYMSRYRSTTSSDMLYGFNSEWKTCHVAGCTIENYTKTASEGNQLRMNELNYLYEFGNTANRIILDKCISDFCDYYTVKSVFADNTDRFWSAFLCVKHNIGCPVKGDWSKWNSWSKCTAACGSGVKYRLRYCDHPKPSRTSLNCTGNYIEFKKCFGKSCLADRSGTWCTWLKWSPCSVRRGGNGISVRKRFCRRFNDSSYMSRSCVGPHTEICQCYVPGVDGGWSEWQRWSPCSAKCDKGIRYRVRSCSRPEPEESGNNCTGESVQISACHVVPCKGPPIMVATFDKQSHIKYSATEVNTTMLNVVLRFYPFDMSGTILRRFFDDCSDCGSVCLKLIDNRLFLEVYVYGCNVTLLSPSTMSIGWNDVAFSISNRKVTLQSNNENVSKYIKCTAFISIMNLNQVMNIGEDFEGYIEKLYVNFVPYALTINNKFSDMYLPYATFNTIYELSEEQSYSNLSKTIKIPCPQPSNIFRLELYLRFELLAHGNLILIKGMTTDYMLVDVNNNIIKLIIKLDDYFDEVIIPFEEIDSSWIHVEIEQQESTWLIDVNGKKRTLRIPADISIELCKNYMYIGNNEDNQNSTVLRGIIGYLKLNDNILNPNDFAINPSHDFNIFSSNLSDILYNEVTMTSEEEIIELSCITNNEFPYEDFDIAWLKYDQPILKKINCEIYNNCIISTHGHVSQITIFPKTVYDDYLYLCISMTKQKIICVYGVVTFNNVTNTSYVMTNFIFVGKLIATLTILFLIILISKINNYN